MASNLEKQIRRSRKLLQNPYAYLDDEGGYSAISVQPPQSVHEARRILENQYAYLDGNGGYSGWTETQAGGRPPSQLVDPVALLQGQQKGKAFSKREIEAIARRLQIELWRQRAGIWPARKDVTSLDVLDPSAALQSIGYSVRMAESLGQYSANGEHFEVAGILDNSHMDVEISRRFSPEIRNFTVAHELGHAILHGGSGLHRDRALDGTAAGSTRNPQEAEADLFASFFLLPAKPVREAFKQRFLTQTFVLNEGTAFALGSKNLESLQSRCRTLRDLARILANAESFNGVHFHSLAKQFRVSSEAMAIRLEELALVVP